MIQKKEFRNLIEELYPSLSLRQSYLKCAKDTGAGFEYLYRMGCESSNNAVRKPFFMLLQFKKDIIKLKQNAFNVNSREELNKKNYERLQEKKGDIKRLVEKIQLDVCNGNKNIVTRLENLTKTLS